MNKFGYLNFNKLMELNKKVTTTEFKMLLVILEYLSSTNKDVLINNKNFREFLDQLGFSKTPERVSTILSSLNRKDVLFREAPGVYTVVESLYLKVNEAFSIEAQI